MTDDRSHATIDTSAESLQRDVRAVECAVRAIGGKWKIVIVVKLAGGPLRFSELLRQMPLISHQSLITQLRQLQRDGVIRREAFGDMPVRVEYALTEMGQKLSPLMPSLISWGYEILNLRAEG